MVKNILSKNPWSDYGNNTTESINKILSERGHCLLEPFKGSVQKKHRVRFASGLENDVRLLDVLTGRIKGIRLGGGSKRMTDKDVNALLLNHGARLAEAYKGAVYKKHLVRFHSGIVEEVVLSRALNGYRRGPRSSTNVLAVSESVIRDALAAREGGRTEIKCPAGSIDVLTDTNVIEVKHCKDWKNAVGQALVYQSFFPNHLPRIHLYGSDPAQRRSLVIGVCKKLGVLLTWE
jgi:hypothetical protein